MFHQFDLKNFNISISFLRNYITIKLVKLTFTILGIRSAQTLVLNLNKLAFSLRTLSISILI